MTDCVNIETKTCIFGYGGIDIGIDMQALVFMGIKPPVGAGTQIWEKDGTKIGNWEFTGSRLYVMFSTMDEVNAVCEHLNAIEAENGGSFVFKGVTFDFTAYMQESMEVVKSAMALVKRNILYLMAC